MATLTVNSKAGSLVGDWATAAAAAGGDMVPNANGGVQVILTNGGGSSVTVTVKSYATVVPAGCAKTDLTNVVEAGRVCHLGPFDKSVWNNTSNQVELTYSAVTSVTVVCYTAA